eukprot:5355880-Prymnesium_polylepis.1
MRRGARGRGQVQVWCPGTKGFGRSCDRRAHRAQRGVRGPPRKGKGRQGLCPFLTLFVPPGGWGPPG